MGNRILFDVGANNGSKWFDDLQNDQTNTFVYMFEPTPYLCDVIKEKYRLLKNWFLVEKAVSNFEGRAVFNIQGLDDWGCSSLLQFNENMQDTYPSTSLWALKHTDQLEVDVTTLNSFLKANEHIDHIDYLHIDAQGSDLNVMKGCSDFLHYIHAGQMEATYNAPLYAGSPPYTECVEWLNLHNFSTNVSYSGQAEECDISFTRI